MCEHKSEVPSFASWFGAEWWKDEGTDVLRQQGIVTADSSSRRFQISHRQVVWKCSKRHGSTRRTGDVKQDGGGGVSPLQVWTGSVGHESMPGVKRCPRAVVLDLTFGHICGKYGIKHEGASWQNQQLIDWGLRRRPWSTYSTSDLFVFCVKNVLDTYGFSCVFQNVSNDRRDWRSWTEGNIRHLEWARCAFGEHRSVPRVNARRATPAAAGWSCGTANAFQWNHIISAQHRWNVFICGLKINILQRRGRQQWPLH